MIALRSHRLPMEMYGNKLIVNVAVIIGVVINDRNTVYDDFTPFVLFPYIITFGVKNIKT